MLYIELGDLFPLQATTTAETTASATATAKATATATTAKTTTTTSNNSNNSNSAGASRMVRQCHADGRLSKATQRCLGISACEKGQCL